jgi:hypothetical protein
MVSGFWYDADEIWALLGYYTASSNNSLLTFQDNIFFFLGFLTLEDGTNTLSRNVGKGLPLNAM